MSQETLRRKQLKVNLGEVPDLSVRQRLRIQVFGNIFIRWVKPAGYSGPVPVYLVKCSRHGLYLDTPHGHHKYFQCHTCLAEAKEEADKKASFKTKHLVHNVNPKFVARNEKG